MKTLIVYTSFHHNNTEKIARAMAGVLDADLTDPEDADIQEYDLIGFGSGIYFGKHDKRLLKLAENLSASGRKKAFVFSTSGLSDRMNIFASHFHNPLKKKLQEKGFDVVGEFNCPGFDTAGPFKVIGGVSKGRPNKEDMEKAKRFAVKMKNEH